MGAPTSPSWTLWASRWIARSKEDKLIENQEQQDAAARFEHALAALEAAAEEPEVPGEAKAWCESTLETCAELDRHWSVYREKMRRTLVDIQANDLSLQPRVDEIRQAARMLEARWEELRARLQNYAKLSSPASRADDRIPIQHLKAELREQVHESRELNTSARTWLIESVYRDRGIVD